MITYFCDVLKCQTLVDFLELFDADSLGAGVTKLLENVEGLGGIQLQVSRVKQAWKGVREADEQTRKAEEEGRDSRGSGHPSE